MATYDCDAPARSVVAVGDGDSTMFAAGTQTIRGGNAVHIVSHDHLTHSVFRIDTVEGRPVR